jgi:MOSC domain-containing protein YiiM
VPLADLLATVPQPGRLTWIGLRTARRGPVEVVDATEAVPGVGLVGDRRAATRSPNPAGKRQVTLIQAEHLEVVAALLGRDGVDPVLVRRNLVVAGVNLQALGKRRFRVGEVVLEGAGPCHPCSRMEEDAALGAGGYQALRGHGGIVARILTAGTLRIGDAVDLLPPGDGPFGSTSDGAVARTPV